MGQGCCLGLVNKHFQSVLHFINMLIHYFALIRESNSFLTFEYFTRMSKPFGIIFVIKTAQKQNTCDRFNKIDNLFRPESCIEVSASLYKGSFTVFFGFFSRTPWKLFNVYEMVLNRHEYVK